jgi:hypothetical protein
MWGYPRIESDSGRGWYRVEEQAEAAGLLTPPSAGLNPLRRIRYRLGGAEMACPKAEGAVVIGGRSRTHAELDHYPFLLVPLDHRR